MQIAGIFRIIINDPIRKVFAIIFAFAIWLFVAVESSYTYARSAELIYVGLPESLTVVDTRQEIKIVLSGKGRSLMQYWITPPKVVCTIPEARVGTNRISTKDLSILSAVPDVDIQYNITAFDIRLDEKVKKIVKVDIPLKGSTKDGYSIGIMSTKDTVEATGPKSSMRTFTSVLTESLDLKNRDRTFEQKLKIMPSFGVLFFNRDYITAEIEIDTTSQRVLTNIPLRLITIPHQNASVTTVYLDTLVVAGTASRIATLKKTDITISIDLATLTAGDYYLPAEIRLPDHVKPVYSSPKKFRLRVY